MCNIDTVTALRFGIHDQLSPLETCRRSTDNVRLLKRDITLFMALTREVALKLFNYMTRESCRCCTPYLVSLRHLESEIFPLDQMGICVIAPYISGFRATSFGDKDIWIANKSHTRYIQHTSKVKELCKSICSSIVVDCYFMAVVCSEVGRLLLRLDNSAVHFSRSSLRF